jgi:hypothetical protein
MNATRSRRALEGGQRAPGIATRRRADGLHAVDAMAQA